jgi:hypothetical protein
MEQSNDQLSWTFLWFPKEGRLLCQSYMDQGRDEDAVAVAATCYAAMRYELLDWAPACVDLQPYVHKFIHWAEIAGAMYSASKQNYMAKGIYQHTLSDLSRLDWDSPRTHLHSAELEMFKHIFQRKIERTGKDESDDDESDDDTEPTIPPSRRFQIATILPSSDISGPIQCTTSTVDFAAAPPYKALSYAWGGSRKVLSYRVIVGPVNETMDIDAVENSLKMIVVDDAERMIRPNLFAALRQLRQQESPLVIWVDAICMDMSAMERRGEWAIKLRDIYKKAEEVIVWLGQGDGQSDKAMTFLQEFWSLRPTLPWVGEYLFATTTTVPWEEICSLLRKEWWGRIWTLQEFCVARKLSVHCGRHSIPWSYLQEFTTFVDIESWTYQFLGEEESSRLQPLIDFVKQRHQYIILVDEYRMDFGFALEKLFQITGHHGSYDPKDKIFALLGLLDQKSDKIAPKLDYRYCPCAVYTDMIVYMRIKEYADDLPRAHAKKATVQSDFRDHLFLWPAEKIENRCDGENCGRRVMCFTNDKSREQRSVREMLDISEKEYKLYIEMKLMEQFSNAMTMSRS